jgi:hypothetical protein
MTKAESTLTPQDTATPSHETDLVRNVRHVADTLTALDTINDAIIMNGNHSYPVTLDRALELLDEHASETELAPELLANAKKELKYSPELITDDGRDVVENYLDNDVLALEFIGTNSAGTNGEWVVTGATLCVTIGGPNIFIETKLTGEWVKIKGYWGSETVERDCYAPALVEYVRMYADNIE